MGEEDVWLRLSESAAAECYDPPPAVWGPAVAGHDVCCSAVALIWNFIQNFTPALASGHMDYTPRYAQPFTFEQATLLDVPVIFEGRFSSRSKHSIIMY